MIIKMFDDDEDDECWHTLDCSAPLNDLAWAYEFPFSCFPPHPPLLPITITLEYAAR